VELSDSVLQHLRQVIDLPDLSATRYTLESEIGRGGMGVVYAAHDRELERRVALKVMDAALSGEPRLIAHIEHPAVVPIYECGRLPDGRAFYAMKLVAGSRLDRYLESNPPLAERLRIVQRAAEALGFAHSRGVLHRDLKPQNVMVGAFGEVYVMDWGVGAVAGTPAFRAPEGNRDARSDIYSLGALLLFTLGPSGRPAALVAIAEKAMRHDAAERYFTAAEILAEIARFQDGVAVEAHRETIWQVLQRYGARNRVLLWLLAAYVGVRFFLFFLRSV
jgi:eukaryotic-like serine/threonine-protein kinase